MRRLLVGDEQILQRRDAAREQLVHVPLDHREILRMPGLDQDRGVVAGDQVGGVVAVIDLALVALRQAVADPEHAGRDLARHALRHRHIEHGLGVRVRLVEHGCPLFRGADRIVRSRVDLTIPTVELRRCQHRFRLLEHERLPRRRAASRPVHTAAAAVVDQQLTREGADDRFEPTHRSDDRRRGRGDDRRAAGVRPSAAGRSRRRACRPAPRSASTKRAMSASATPRSARASRCWRRPAAAELAHRASGRAR